jgi:aminoglycoside phosphotransferase family enzyme/predicted kinase
MSPTATQRTFDELRRGLEASGAGAVQVRETHVSWVLLAGQYAYKLKKPVRFGFVDQSTAQRRRRCCEAEVEVNRPLAPGVVLGVRPVVESPHGVRVGAAGEGPAVDWVVVMRRFDEEHTLAARLRRDDVPAGSVQRIAGRVAAFHAWTPATAPGDWPDTVLATWNRNVDELEPLADVRAAGSARRFGCAFVSRRRSDLAARASAGLVRDGHGDLRAEHVLIEGEDVTILDRLEFDPALRRVDVADDLAFLTMDLESLGAGGMAKALVEAYREAGGDPGEETLLAFFAAYRALVRAKVELLGEEAARSRAAALLALAERLMWRARGPLLLAISGPPASGKTTLAGELGRRSGLPVVSSDVVRKDVLGISPATPAPSSAYEPSARAAVYEELGRRARAAAAAGGVIVDATFGEAPLRDAFAAGAADLMERLRVVECRAPLPVLTSRAGARSTTGHGASDADARVAARLAERFSPWPLPGDRRLALRSEEPADVLAERCAAWLDGEVGRGG